MRCYLSETENELFKPYRKWIILNKDNEYRGGGSLGLPAMWITVMYIDIVLLKHPGKVYGVGGKSDYNHLMKLLSVDFPGRYRNYRFLKTEGKQAFTKHVQLALRKHRDNPEHFSGYIGLIKKGKTTAKSKGRANIICDDKVMTKDQRDKASAGAISSLVGMMKSFYRHTLMSQALIRNDSYTELEKIGLAVLVEDIEKANDTCAQVIEIMHKAA